MNRLVKQMCQLSRLLTLIVTVFLTTISASVPAQDIEIYNRLRSTDTSLSLEEETNINSNLLFVLDTSRSLTLPIPVAVDVPTTVYDSEVDYPGSGADDLIYVYDTSLNFLSVTIPEDQNRCQAYRDFITANPNNPVFTDQLIQWRVVGTNGGGTNLWSWVDSNIIESSLPTVSVDCLSDVGVHGFSSTGVRVYPRNPNTPRVNADPRYNPNNRVGQPAFVTSTTYIIVPGNYHNFLQSSPRLVDLDVAATTGTTLGFPESSFPCLFPREDGGTDILRSGQLILIDGEVFACRRRLDVVQTALADSIAGFEDVNVGLMLFNSNVDENSNGGTVVESIENINAPGVRLGLINTLNTFQANATTPITESLYEAYRYFRGQSPEFIDLSLPLASRNLTDPEALSGANYSSPILSECQTNNIILLTDGEPSLDDAADAPIRALTGSSCSFRASGESTATDNLSCADELVSYMANNDLAEDARVPGINSVFTYTVGFASDIPLLDDITRVGAQPGSSLRSSIVANDVVSLGNAFRAIFSDIQTVDVDVFVAPAVSVDSFNRLQNRDDLYFLLFRPEANPRWRGNLKRYTIDPEGEILDVNDNPAVSSSTGLFVDSAQSFWSSSPDGAVVADGGAAEQLNVNRRLFISLDDTSDTVLSLTQGGTISPGSDAFRALPSPRDIALSSTTSDLLADVSPATLRDSLQRALQLTAGFNLGEISLLGSVDVNRFNILKWTLGTDVDNERGLGSTESNNYLGENLHGSPYILNFGTDESSPQDVIFYTTNQGMLHAVNAQAVGAGLPEGSELWSYIPDPDLLTNLGEYYNRTNPNHVYGLDASIAFDVERDASSGEVTQAFLYFGQRRGGSNYYAVDVLNALDTGVGATPVAKLFTIQGGEGDFQRMGQSWATPVETTISYCPNSNPDSCENRDVLIISGGYDTQYDNALVDVESLRGEVLGNAIYIVDAQVPEIGETDTRGEVLWMVSGEGVSTDQQVLDPQRDLQIAEMEHSIPSEPTVIDINGDGVADLMFAIDISGQVFRIDFDVSTNDPNRSGIRADDNNGAPMSVSGDIIADLSESAVNRRFYNRLDTTILRAEFDSNGRELVGNRYAMVTGSGYRAHPVLDEELENRFYVLFDEDLATGSSARDYLYAVNGSGVPALIDMDIAATALGETEVVIPPEEPEPLDLAGEHHNGYFLNLTEPAEKALAPSVIIQGQAISVLYEPSLAPTGDDDTPGCQAFGIGTSRALSLDLGTGGVIFVELERVGLAPQPAVLHIVGVNSAGNEELRPIVIIGTESFEATEFNLRSSDGAVGKGERRAWWEENSGISFTVP